MMWRTWTGALALTLVSCALVDRPEAELATARAAIMDAESAGAAERSPNELASARDKLARAQQRARLGHFDEAQWLAEQAEVDARLAALRARAASVEAARDAVQRARSRSGAPVRTP